MTVSFDSSQIRFQSPSHRGSGTTQESAGISAPLLATGFNPLLIGEAAPPGPSFNSSRLDEPELFQSPSHRGSGTARTGREATDATVRFRFNPLLIGEAAPPMM